MDSTPAKTVVLFIDDEIQIRRLIRACLEKNGYEALEAATGKDGLAAAIDSQPGIIILDLGLPDMDGMTVLRRLREWSKIPVIVLSVRDRDSDKVLALDSGANDYLSKPFSTNELLARLRVLQRYHQPAEKPSVFNSSQLQVDLAARTVKVRGHPVQLARTEYALLRYFVQHAGRVLTHRQLLREVWHLEDAGKTARLRVYVTYLREKLELNPSKPELLITVPGVGYRLNVSE
ncbi:MAG TPA: response regulator transcription factor [Candidatus Saccharimonadales bacterium]|nr:response regulator transcription factor [Candidatus Saccharimonadales bacterium]